MKKLFLIIALLGTLIPVIFVLDRVGGLENWQGVTPKGSVDSLYYYARIQEVANGHPLVGNPFVYEQRDVFSPAFFLPDIVSALPILVGIPFNLAIIFNMALWSFVFLLLSFTLLRQLGMPKWWAVTWAILAFITSYSFIIRPTVMQLVYPLFLVFLIVLSRFLEEPQNRRRIIWLSLVAAATFYVYTYLAYIVFLTLAFIFVWLLFTRRFLYLRALTIVGLSTALLLIPFGFITWLQMNDPYYFETFSRIGLVYTHIPAVEAFFYGRWIVIALLSFSLLWFFFPKNEEGSSPRKLFWFAIGAGLFGGLFLNVITGVELTLAVHVGRFVTLWMTMTLAALSYEWYVSRPIKFSETKISRKILYIGVALLLIFFTIGVMRNVPRGLSFFQFDNRGDKIADIQVYAPPLRWLDDNEPEESVVWANDSISLYIPIMTRHYPLFTLGAGLHSLSSAELKERYLLSRSLNTLTIEILKEDLDIYAGAGVGKDQPRAENRRIWLCQTLSRIERSKTCPPKTDAITMLGGEYFEKLLEQFSDIKKNRALLLKQYNVKYLIIDKSKDNLNPKQISGNEPLYDDGRFVILSLPL